MGPRQEWNPVAALILIKTLQSRIQNLSPSSKIKSSHTKYTGFTEYCVEKWRKHLHKAKISLKWRWKHSRLLLQLLAVSSLSTHLLLQTPQFRSTSVSLLVGSPPFPSLPPLPPHTGSLSSSGSATLPHCIVTLSICILYSHPWPAGRQLPSLELHKVVFKHLFHNIKNYFHSVTNYPINSHNNPKSR